MSEQPKQAKWGKGKIVLFAVLMVLLMIVVPLALVFYMLNKLSQIH